VRTFDALGYQFAVSCTNDVSADQVWAALEGLATDADVAGLDEFVVGGSTGGSTMTLERLVGLINLRSLVALQAGNLVLHSGAVCAPTGATVLLCGPSGSGKSTLTATLVGRGHAYVTDELVCPDGRGRFNHFRSVHLPGQPEASIYWTPTTGAHGLRGGAACRRPAADR